MKCRMLSDELLLDSLVEVAVEVDEMLVDVSELLEMLVSVLLVSRDCEDPVVEELDDMLVALVLVEVVSVEREPEDSDVEVVEVLERLPWLLSVLELLVALELVDPVLVEEPDVEVGVEMLSEVAEVLVEVDSDVELTLLNEVEEIDEIEVELLERLDREDKDVLVDPVMEL